MTNVSPTYSQDSPYAARSLAGLLSGLEYTLRTADGAAVDARLETCEIVTISADSRSVVPGAMFVALPGSLQDGHNFIADAITKGAVAVLCQSGRAEADTGPAGNTDCIFIEVEEPAIAYAVASANFFGNPSESLCCLGITGTNGKTTVTYLVEQILSAAGKQVGVIGTVNNRYRDRSGSVKIIETGFTTPQAFELQRVLREMADAGVEFLVMEVSSHALAQARVGMLRFSVAAFTNLTRDHLDFHGTMEEYFGAKAMLFNSYLLDDGVAILPDDVPASDDGEDQHNYVAELRQICERRGVRRISWGSEEKSDLRLLEYEIGLHATRFSLAWQDQRFAVESPLVGRFNIDNIMTAFGVVLGLEQRLGLDALQISRTLASCSGAPGRLERVVPPSWQDCGPVVLVDYAHTPDALEKVLQTVKELPHGELFCVFGCGGDRDKGKRPQMGRIAARYSDVAIVTDDNPRTEDPDGIVAEILPGVTGVIDRGMEVIADSAEPGCKWLLSRSHGELGCVVLRDRRTAIEYAIRAAGPHDIVVIAGKGHEPYQLNLSGKRFFDDRLEALRVLCSWNVQLVVEATKGRLMSLGTSQENNENGYMDGLLCGVTTDSRKVGPKSVFVALKGDNHDGHDFVEQAVLDGASCVVVERPVSLPATLGVSVSQVIVADTLKAFGDLAGFMRRRIGELSHPAVIGLTGSCGKTTVKEMVAAILARRWPEGPQYPVGCVLKTQGNFNNLIGLPLSLLPLDIMHRAAVMEMGMNQPGELECLGAIGDPDISCITNIHGAHLERLHSIEGVAKAKEELFAATRKDATLVVNMDDPRVAEIARRYPQRQVTFSAQGNVEVDFFASHIAVDANGLLGFHLHHAGHQERVHLFVPGEHNVSNALAAAAIASCAGASLANIVAGLADFRPTDKRMHLEQGPAGMIMINDTYNANPASMAAGLRTLCSLVKGKKLAIIGDMLELGSESAKAHEQIGQLIAELDYDRVAVVGEFAEDVLRGTGAAGSESQRSQRCVVLPDKDSSVRWLRGLVDELGLGPEDGLLVKASRGRHFETIVAALQNSQEGL